MCNLTLYTSLHWAAQRSTRALTGFVHLPALPAQMARERTPQASMAIELQQAAVQIVITESCRVFDAHHGEAQSP
jgi:pyrrolidone-carboxylate peptidase